VNQDTTRQLREAGWAHQPDRARMLARIERGMAGQAGPAVRHARPARRWPRVALATLASAGVLATGGLAVAAIVRTPPPEPPAVAPADPTPAVSPSPTPTERSTAAAPSSTPSSPRPTPSASSRAQNGPLTSSGSVNRDSTVFWEQDDLTLKTGRPLGSLTVELRIAQTGEVKDTGNWRTLPPEDFTFTVQETGGTLVYRWVLKPGRTVPAGQHMFAGQFNHATSPRNAAGDSYRVETSDGPAAVWGGFGPAR